jgi:hypothetical protein
LRKHKFKDIACTPNCATLVRGYPF